MLQRIYPKNWKAISRQVRFVEAGGKCENCGVRHRSIHPVTGSIVHLTTSHLDRNTMNTERENLLSLCQYCHLHYDRRDNIRLRRARALLRTNPIPLFPSEHYLFP